MGIHQAPSPGPPFSDCPIMPLFWRVLLSSNCSVFILSPKVIPTFFFLFTFKPSQALLSLWFLLTAFERFKMLFFSYSCGRWPRRQGCWFECPFSSQRQNQDPGWGSWFFCEATLSTDAFVSDLAGDRVLSTALWVSTCPTEPLPTGDRCFLYPPGWPAFMSGKLNISKLFPGSCSLKSSFLRVRCQFLLALVGGGTSGKFFIMNWPWY